MLALQGSLNRRNGVEDHISADTSAASASAVIVGSTRAPLRSLSIDEVVVLFKILGLPADCDSDCESAIRVQKISGMVLDEIHDEKDINDLGLPLIPLRARMLLKHLNEFRQSGVPVDLLQQAPLAHPLSHAASSNNQSVVPSPASATSHAKSSNLVLSSRESSSSTAAATSLSTTAGYSSTIANSMSAASTIVIKCAAGLPMINANGTAVGSSVPDSATSQSFSTASISSTSSGAPVNSLLPSKFQKTGERQDNLFSIVPVTDLTTAIGIRAALDHLVEYLEDPSYAIYLSSEGNQQAAARVLDAIPAFIAGSEDADGGGSKQRMLALGDPDTRIIVSLSTLLDLLIYSTSEPSYFAASAILVKTLVAVQKMMRYRDDDPKTSCDENITGFGDAGLCEVLVEVIKRYRCIFLQAQEFGSAPDTLASIITECCRAIRYVTFDNAGNQVKYGSVPGSMYALVDVLLAYGRYNPTVAEACCAAVRIVTCNVDNRASYVSVPGSMDVLVDVLKAHHRNSNTTAVTKQCCGTICNVTAKDANNNFSYEDRSVGGLMDVLVDVLKAHGASDAAVADTCCGAITNITVDFDNRADYGEISGSMDVLVNVLKAHSTSNSVVAVQCCGAIANITTSPRVRASYGSLPPKAMDTLVDVFEVHGRSEFSGGHAVNAFALHAYPENIVKYGQVPESIQALVDVLKAHSARNAAVVERCCRAITNLCLISVRNRVSSDNQAIYGQVPGSIEALIDVLKTHGKIQASKGAVELCCYAIESLCEGNASNRVKFKELDIIQLLENEVTVANSSAKHRALQMLLVDEEDESSEHSDDDSDGDGDDDDDDESQSPSSSASSSSSLPEVSPTLTTTPTAATCATDTATGAATATTAAAVIATAAQESDSPTTTVATAAAAASLSLSATSYGSADTAAYAGASVGGTDVSVGTVGKRVLQASPSDDMLPPSKRVRAEEEGKIFSIVPVTVAGIWCVALNSLVVELWEAASTPSSVYGGSTSSGTATTSASSTASATTAAAAAAAATVYSDLQSTDVTQRAIVHVLDAVEAYIGNDDDGRSLERMLALGAPETHMIETLNKLLKVLLLLLSPTSSSPSSSSPSGGDSCMLLLLLAKALVTMQKMMRCTSSPTSHVSCDENIRGFGDAGTFQILLEIIQKHLLLREGEEHGGPANTSVTSTASATTTVANTGTATATGTAGTTIAVVFAAAAAGTTTTCTTTLVLAECCRAIGIIASAKEVANQTTCARVLVDVLKTPHSLSIAEVVCACCEAIRSITAANRERFGSTDVFSALVNVLKVHGKVTASRRAVEQCCLTIAALCTPGSPANKRQFIELDTVHVLVSEVTVVDAFWKKIALDALK